MADEPTAEDLELVSRVTGGDADAAGELLTKINNIAGGGSSFSGLLLTLAAVVIYQQPAPLTPDDLRDSLGNAALRWVPLWSDA